MIILQEPFFQRILEQSVDVPVPQIMKTLLVEAFQLVPREGIKERIAEQIVDFLGPLVMATVQLVPQEGIQDRIGELSMQQITEGTMFNVAEAIQMVPQPKA